MQLADKNLHFAKKNVIMARRIAVLEKLLRDSRRYVEWAANFMENEDAQITLERIDEFVK